MIKLYTYSELNNKFITELIKKNEGQNAIDIEFAKEFSKEFDKEKFVKLIDVQELVTNKIIDYRLRELILSDLLMQERNKNETTKRK